MSLISVFNTRRNDLLENDPVYRVDFEIWDDETNHCVANGLICWSSGINVHLEDIDPSRWTELSKEIFSVTRKAREMIGDMWVNGEPA